MTSPATSKPFTPSRATLEEEYRGLREHLQQIGSRVDAVRTFGVGAVGAALILAVQQRLAVVALGGAALAHCFALVDLTNAYRYATFAKRARLVELALDAYYAFEREGDDAAEENVLSRLDGLDKRPFQLELYEPGRNEMAFMYPRAVFRVLYPALFSAGVVLAIVLQVLEGPAVAVAAVAAAAVVLSALCVPSYLDPSKAPLQWWKQARVGLSTRRYGGKVTVVVAAALIAVALGVLWPLVQQTPEQAPGTLSVTANPAVQNIAVTLSAKPRCSRFAASLVIRGVGSARTVTVRLPRQLRMTSQPSRSLVTARVRGSTSRFELQATPSKSMAGRCTFAIPALLATGQAQRADVDVQAPDAVRVADPASSDLQLVPQQIACSATAAVRPAVTCAGVISLDPPFGSSARAWRVAIAALLAASGIGLITRRLFVGASAHPPTVDQA
jgi:hypothetical protein